MRKSPVVVPSTALMILPNEEMRVCANSELALSIPREPAILSGR